jgi:amyloid beta precursor protein binding protein 1
MARSYDHESNFQEAVDHYYLAYRSPKPSDELNALLEQYRNKNVTPYLSSFEYMLHALDIFIRTTGQTQGFPPLPGVIPDMTATTEAYVNLQAAYHAKAEQDRTLFKQILNQLIQVSRLKPSSHLRPYYLSTLVF